ncbi:hypothetical protein [uncultured Streptococcus sp.]|uniref:hypothetical protein n=1 Tax=uncultured Streptococcus sp. TaxID=83427 RepID=UPI0025991017|nr:hypothetical protein [uncultured Streptococcus sp.]
MDYNNFEKSIEYKSAIDYSDKSFDADKRAAVLAMHGDIYISGRTYTVFLTYHLNSKEKLSLYHNSFLQLNDGLDYTIMGPAPALMSIEPFEAKRGKGQASFEKTLAKISEEYGLSRATGISIGTRLSSDATDYFDEWKKEEIEKIWPTSKLMSLKLENVKYTDDSCVLNLKLSLDKDYDMCIELYPHDDRNWFLGLNTWDIVGDMVISIKDDCKFYCNYRDWKQKFNVFFGNVKDLPHFKGMVGDFIDEYAKKWKDSYFKNFYKQHFLNENVSDKIEWGFDFMEPMMTTDTTIWGNGNLKVEFSKSKILDAMDDETLEFYDPEKFARYLMKFICGNLKLKISIPKNPDLISYTRNDMGKGDFLEVIQRHVCKDTQKAIIRELGYYLIDEFWGEKFTLPKNTDNVLKELGASYKQRRIVAEDFELIKGGKNE